MTRIDVHQHLWTEPLLDALSARDAAPRVRRRGRLWELELPNEPTCRIDVDGDDATVRAVLVKLDRLDVALLSLSAALGVEGLPREEADAIIDGYERGIEALPEAFGAWGALPLREAEPRDVDALLDRGYAGVSLPAGALATPALVDECGTLLERLERRGAPVFVHPGPNPWSAQPPRPPAVPAWWPALTDYVTSLHSAWHAFAAHGRRLFPKLTVVFAALAGGAPLHAERLAARGGPAGGAVDRGIYYDTSSYGAKAIDAMVRVVGIDQLVHGSDRPVVAPHAAPGPLGQAAWHAFTVENPARLFAVRSEALAA